jgi:hypothetical protein
VGALSADTEDGHIWSDGFGGSATKGRGVAVDASGGPVVVGVFSGTVDFGGGAITSNGDLDLFVAEFVASAPIVTTINDVGNDQGRLVNVRFDAASFDRAGAAPPITSYEIYRRDDAPPATINMLRDAGWTLVGIAPAHGQATYAIDAPTVGDSTSASGMYYSVFFVRAATANPVVFFDSPPDSGYSLDNLTPGVPTGLLYSTGLLSWDESLAADFDYFSVYGTAIDDFGTAALIAYTVDPQMDVTDEPYPYYFVTATDFSGNESGAAGIDVVTGVEGTPRAYSLSISNHPNPFNPATTVVYSLPSRGAVSITVYDASGERVATLLHNAVRSAGTFRIEWDGRLDSGALARSGVYFAKLDHSGVSRTLKLVLLK